MMDDVIIVYNEEKFKIEQFMKRMVNFFQDNPCFHQNPLPIVHSVKYRMKNEKHLCDKIKRKRDQGVEVTKENIFDVITDLAGIRVLHIYSEQFENIHGAIKKEIQDGELFFYENPKAYTWDYDLKSYYEGLGIETIVKPSYYTSVHYVVMPQKNSKIKCEIQVRTLYEEVWGEIDHSMNYPYACESLACKEQLKVLAQMTAAGTRLANSIIKSKDEYDILLKNGT